MMCYRRISTSTKDECNDHNKYLKAYFESNYGPYNSN